MTHWPMATTWFATWLFCLFQPEFWMVASESRAMPNAKPEAREEPHGW